MKHRETPTQANIPITHTPERSGVIPAMVIGAVTLRESIEELATLKQLYRTKLHQFQTGELYPPLRSNNVDELVKIVYQVEHQTEVEDSEHDPRFTSIDDARTAFGQFQGCDPHELASCAGMLRDVATLTDEFRLPMMRPALHSTIEEIEHNHRRFGIDDKAEQFAVMQDRLRQGTLTRSDFNTIRSEIIESFQSLSFMRLDSQTIDPSTVQGSVEDTRSHPSFRRYSALRNVIIGSTDQDNPKHLRQLADYLDNVAVAEEQMQKIQAAFPSVQQRMDRVNVSIEELQKELVDGIKTLADFDYFFLDNPDLGIRPTQERMLTFARHPSRTLEYEWINNWLFELHEKVEQALLCANPDRLQAQHVLHEAVYAERAKAARAALKAAGKFSPAIVDAVLWLQRIARCAELRPEVRIRFGQVEVFGSNGSSQALLPQLYTVNAYRVRDVLTGSDQPGGDPHAQQKMMDSFIRSIARRLDERYGTSFVSPQVLRPLQLESNAVNGVACEKATTVNGQDTVNLESIRDSIEQITEEPIVNVLSVVVYCPRMNPTRENEEEAARIEQLIQRRPQDAIITILAKAMNEADWVEKISPHIETALVDMASTRIADAQRLARQLFRQLINPDRKFRQYGTDTSNYHAEGADGSVYIVHRRLELPRAGGTALVWQFEMTKERQA